jgi:predicted pyridoxine 5'-phosphate oxidase superfamily flavin-nucleotide-binding protein
MTALSDAPGPFHADELAAQALAQQSSPGTGIRPFMPDQHREFFAGLPYLFMATADRRGWPVASLVTGAPGFVQSPDPTTLTISARPGEDDPAAAGLLEGAPIGVLGLDLTNRRRNRANGIIRAINSTGITVDVMQSFGNCAQYIQTRHPMPRAAAPAAAESIASLDPAAQRLIADADTFFVASRSREGLTSGGLDVSHRGGRPGFVGVHGDVLRIPDFRGNRFFNTLGNLLGDPRAGLLFLDFASGELLQLQGLVTIEWSPKGTLPAGAQRLWRFAVERGFRRRNALAFDWKFGEFAPTTLATATWTAED